MKTKTEQKYAEETTLNRTNMWFSSPRTDCPALRLDEKKKA